MIVLTTNVIPGLILVTAWNKHSLVRAEDSIATTSVRKIVPS